MQFILGLPISFECNFTTLSSILPSGSSSLPSFYLAVPTIALVIIPSAVTTIALVIDIPGVAVTLQRVDWGIPVTRVSMAGGETELATLPTILWLRQPQSPEVVTKCPIKWPAWKVSMVIFVRKLEVVQKQVRGFMIPYYLQLACVWKLEIIWVLHNPCQQFQSSPAAAKACILIF